MRTRAAHLLGDAIIVALTIACRQLDHWLDWCHWRGHDPAWTGSVVACRTCGADLSTP